MSGGPWSQKEHHRLRLGPQLGGHRRGFAVIMIQVGLTLKSISSQQVQTEHQNIRLPNAIDRCMLDTAVPTLSRCWDGGYRIGEGHCLDSMSLSGFKNDNDARR